MEEIRFINTTHYYLEDGFRVEIVDEADILEAWLYNVKYGIKSLMFAVDTTKNKTSFSDFVEMVEDNYPIHIAYYLAEFMKEDEYEIKRPDNRRTN